MDGMFPYGAIVALGVFVYESVWACVCVVRIGVEGGCTLSGCVCCIPGKFVGFFLYWMCFLSVRNLFIYLFSFLFFLGCIIFVFHKRMQWSSKSWFMMYSDMDPMK